MPPPGRHYTGATEITDHVKGILATDYRESADIAPKHSIESHKNRLVRKADDKIARANIQHGFIATAFRFENAQQIALGDDSREATLSIHDGQSAVTSEVRVARGNAINSLGDFHLRGNRGDISKHDLADFNGPHYVGFKILVGIQSAARKLFGHDGIGQVANGDQIGDDANQHERKDGVEVARDFKCENDKRKCGARRRAKYGAHGNQGKSARGEMHAGEQIIDPGSEAATHCRAGHKCRGEQTS